MLNPYITYMHIKDAGEDGKVVPAGEGIGNVGAILKKYYAMGGRDLTLEPHLKVFDGMKDLEKDFDAGKIGQRKVYPDARTAFDAAVTALNGLIKEV
jgi:sugar phosphate isomerase/epimerase